MADNKLTVEDKMTIKELEDKIKSMKEDKEKKCKAAKEQLIEMLEVTADKYRTATGTAEALRVLRFVLGEKASINYIEKACSIAHLMADSVCEMIIKAQDLPYAEMDQLCDGFYNKDFKYNGRELEVENGIELACEMMCIDLCRNVGGAAEDMVEFIKRVEADIDDTGKQLKELKAKEK